MKAKLRRRRASRRPKSRVVVVTEGEVTEPGYLRSFEKLHATPSVVLEAIGLGQDPRAVVERTVEERQRAASDDDAERDSFWAMFDRDEHIHFREAIERGMAEGIQMAISNPCFELWAILHYEEVEGPIDRHAAKQRLRELCSTYSRSNKRFRDEEAIRVGHADAVRRARGLAGGAEEHGNPSTTVSELTEYMRTGELAP